MKENRYYGCVAAVFVLLLVCKFFCIDILNVRGNSMKPAIKDGELIAVNRLAYGLVVPFKNKFLLRWKEPKAGDVVIFPHEGKMVVKRVAASSGSHLDFSVDTEYNLLLGGNKIKLTEIQYSRMSQFDSVPEGFVLVLGDNLSESIDSRNYGFVSENNITGKIFRK